MKNIPIDAVRSFVIMGHSGCGKTTLADALLFKLGLNDRLGSVDNGSSMADWTDPEKERNLTLYAKPFSGPYESGGKGCHMVFCDTPGYMDFFGQVVSASRVCDNGLIVIDGTSGIQIGTNKAWHRAGELDMPCAIVVTGLDRDNADFAGTVGRIQEAWGDKCVPVVLPLPDGNGVADVLAAKGPAGDIASEVEELKGKLVELAAETDDSLIEKYLGGEELSATEIADGLRESVRTGRLAPIFACMPAKDVGVSELLDGIVRLLPSPAECTVKDVDGNEISAAPDSPLAAFVWRTTNDPYVGQLTFIRIYGGTLKSDSELFNVTRDEKERVASLMCINGKQQDSVENATAGDIVALAKLKHTKLNDTLCVPGHKTTLSPMRFPEPVASCSVKAKSRGDEDKIGTALNRLAEEDPTIRVERNSDTKEMLLSGMGDVHLEVSVAQMKARSNVDVLLETPKVPYRETVTAQAKGHHKHKKQSGGHGQYGEVYLRVEPKAPEEEEWFASEIVGGAIPSNFIPAVQKGLVEGMAQGTIAGYPVTNVKVTLYDGTFHEVDSSEIAFKIAASKAFKDAMDKAKPVLLEPVMTVRVVVPDRFMGDVSGDMSHKRGRILGVDVEEGLQVISAEVPRAELARYSAELRSMTAGEGTFGMSFARYDVVPGNIAEKVVSASGKEKDAE